MVYKEPKFMQDLHKIRERMSRESKKKSLREVIFSITKSAKKKKV